MAGVQAIHVPYKGGAPAAVDVMGGRIAYYFAGMPVGSLLAKSGKARVLAVTSKTRFAGAPDIPTVAEQGLPEYEATLWWASSRRLPSRRSRGAHRGRCSQGARTFGDKDKLQGAE